MTLVHYHDNALALGVGEGNAQDLHRQKEGQKIEEAVWRTLIGDKSHIGRPAPSKYG